MARSQVVLYRVDCVFVGDSRHLCAEARLKHAIFSEGKQFFTECDKPGGPVRVRVPKGSMGPWARSEYEAWQVAIDFARIRREQVILDLQLESARTHALLVGAAWVEDERGA
jgi:hypothetical protein